MILRLILVTLLIGGVLAVWKFGGGEEATSFYGDMDANGGVHYQGETLVTTEQYRAVKHDLEEANYPVTYRLDVIDIMSIGVILDYSFITDIQYDYLDSSPINDTTLTFTNTFPVLLLVALLVTAMVILFNHQGGGGKDKSIKAVKEGVGG